MAEIRSLWTSTDDTKVLILCDKGSFASGRKLHSLAVILQELRVKADVVSGSKQAQQLIKRRFGGLQQKVSLVSQYRLILIDCGTKNLELVETLNGVFRLFQLKGYSAQDVRRWPQICCLCSVEDQSSVEKAS